MVGNSADDACTPSHAQALFEGVARDNKEMHELKARRIITSGQPELAAKSALACDWMQKQSLMMRLTELADDYREDEKWARINGLHHGHYTGNMKELVQFFSDVLGMRLQELYWMHGVEGAWQRFMEMGETQFAFAFCAGQ